VNNAIKNHNQPLGFFTAADVARHDVHIHAACSEIFAGALELVTVASRQRQTCALLTAVS